MNPSQIIAAWLLSAMTTWNPPVQSWYPPALAKAHPEILETPEQMKTRYESIVNDLVSVVYEPNYVPFTGTRASDAMYALNIAKFESGGYRKDVDIGVTVGDNGQSPCLMGVWMPPKHIHPGLSTSKEGWTNKDVRYDRVKCFVTGLDRMRSSWKMCIGHNILDRFAGYTIGHCKANEPQSRIHSAFAFEFMKKTPQPTTDQEVLDDRKKSASKSDEVKE